MKTYEQGVNDMAEKVASILKERSKGEYDTWGFVAMFMEMIDEAKISCVASNPKTHSPLPWTLHQEPAGPSICWSDRAGRYLIAETAGRTINERNTNAAFIVNACNNYESTLPHAQRLAEALKQLRKEIEPMAAQIICPRDNTFTRQLQTIDKVLADWSAQ
jgi:hypothetical protein